MSRGIAKPGSARTWALAMVLYSLLVQPILVTI